MCNLKLSVFFIALSVTLSCLEATPIERLLSVADDLSDGTSKRQGWMLPVMSQNTLSGLSEEMPEQPAAKTKSLQLEKRRCSAATCVTQRLADFLVRARGGAGAARPPTDVGSGTYGKRRAGTEPRSPAALGSGTYGERRAGTEPRSPAALGSGTYGERRAGTEPRSPAALGSGTYGERRALP